MLTAKRSASPLDEHVVKVLAQAPPLNDQQRNRIAALLRVGGGAPQRDRDRIEDIGLADAHDRVGDGPHAVHAEESMPS